ncbi:MAG: hypothetical protein Q9160_007395 [Pyrenula sp. 1 TL-2023]
MALPMTALILLSIYILADAVNDIEIDYNNLPGVGFNYTLQWSNPESRHVDRIGCSMYQVLTPSSIIQIDLDEISDPSAEVHAKAGLRVGANVSNTGYYEFPVPEDVRSGIQYRFQIQPDDYPDDVSQSGNFLIQGASGMGLPPLSYVDLGSSTRFYIEIQTFDDPSAFSTIFVEDYSSTTEDPTTSSAPTTSTSSASTIAPTQPTNTDAAGTLSEPSLTPGTSMSQPTGHSTSAPSAHHMSGGAIAAITISMVFAAAIGVALFLYIRHRRRRRSDSQYHSQPAEVAEILPTEPYSDKEVHNQSNYNNNINGSSSYTTSPTNISPGSPLLSRPSEIIGGGSTSSIVNSPRLSELAASSPVMVQQQQQQQQQQQRGSELDGSSVSARG